jgi:hypothetical protein
MEPLDLVSFDDDLVCNYCTQASARSSVAVSAKSAWTCSKARMDEMGVPKEELWSYVTSTFLTLSQRLKIYHPLNCSKGSDPRLYGASEPIMSRDGHSWLHRYFHGARMWYSCDGSGTHGMGKGHDGSQTAWSIHRLKTSSFAAWSGACCTNQNDRDGY